MPRTITVKGIGKASARPDLTVLTMTLESKDMNYDKAMEAAAVNIEKLKEALGEAGFEKSLLKTSNFNVCTNYESVHDGHGNYKSVFDGYVVRHNLKLEFDFETESLSKALAAISKCLSDPQLNISFTVKDNSAINEEVLRSASENARKKAEILCSASNVKLGALLNIDYNWKEQGLYSNTRYNMTALAAVNSMDMAPMRAKGVDIEPEDISVSDTVAFVWEIQ